MKFVVLKLIFGAFYCHEEEIKISSLIFLHPSFMVMMFLILAIINPRQANLHLDALHDPETTVGSFQSTLSFIDCQVSFFHTMHAKEFLRFNAKKHFGRFDTAGGTNLASV